MLAPSVHPLLWLLGCALLRASTDSSVLAVTGQALSTSRSPDVQDRTSEPSVTPTTPTAPTAPTAPTTPTAPTAPTAPTTPTTPTAPTAPTAPTTPTTPTTPTYLIPTSVGQTTPDKASSISTKPLPLTTQGENASGHGSAAASPTQGQEPKRSESPTTSAAPGTSKPVTPTPKPSGSLPEPTPTDDKSPLTVAAFGVISFIVILIVVVIILVSVVSLRFKCNRSKDSEDKQKPGTSMVSESCSAGPSQKDSSITLISMKNINMNNSMSYPPSEKVL